MASQALELAGTEWGEAFRQMLAEHDAVLAQASAPRARPRGVEDGPVWIFPENQPAAALWLIVGASAFDVGWDGSWTTTRSGLLLEFARELCREDDTLKPLALVQQMQTIADTVRPLQHEQVAEQQRRDKAQQTRGKR